LDKLTSFAQQHDILIFLMAHPTKMPKNIDGKYEVPTLYNISGSANFYNKADFGITVHRDFDGGFTEVHVQKVKFRHLGDKGVATFKYNLNNGRYSEYEDNIPPAWDNTNHLVEKARENLKQAESEAVFEFEHDFDNDLPF
jgi:twinkle protein